MNYRKLRILPLFLFLCLFLSACSGERKDETVYNIYYVNAEGTGLIEVGYQPEAENFDSMMEELIDQLTNAPAGYNSPLKAKTTIVGYERGIDALRIDFSKDYYTLDNVEEVLLRSAVVKTFTQVPGVSSVMITVNKVQLTTADGVVIPAMNQNSFIESKDGGVNSYVQANLYLYFQNQDSDLLHCEERDIHYPSNMILEKVVLEQLMKGSENEALIRPLDPSIKVLNVTVKDGICTINLSKDANLTSQGAIADPELAINAVVNSICKTCEDITGVKFEIEGESDIQFRKTIDLNQVFTFDEKLTDTGTTIPVNHGTYDEQLAGEEAAEEENVNAAEDIARDAEADLAQE